MTSANEEIAEETRVVDACWKRLRTITLIDQTWPAADAIPAEEALHRWVPEIHEQLATKHALIHRFGVIPIVAVVGLLNSGKSSLTASFLSQSNRTRVLRGLGRQEGSQRFTLWIPHVWKEDAAFFEKLLNLLAQVFETEPELLADDPETAREQQNAVDRLACPLIATDPLLTKHKLGILDCPDIQRASGNAEDDKPRLEMVKRSASICAAAFVVYARNQIEICTLQTILDAMPDARRIHVVNLIKDESASQIRREARTVLNLRSHDPVYGAYDFLSASYTDHTPMWDANRSRSPEERLAASEPCFFELREEESENTPPSKIAEDRSMAALAQRLTPQAVKSRRMKELLQEFYQDLQSGLDQLERELDKKSGALAKASHRLRDECQELLTKDGHVQIKMSPEIIHGMEQSLGRTASFYYKWLLLPPRKFFQAASRLIEKGRQFSPLPGKDLRKKKAELEAKWQVQTDGKIARGTVTPMDVQRMLSLWSGATGDYQDPESWQEEAEAILQRFLTEDKTNLTETEWDALTAPLWEQLPKRARMKLVTSACLMLGGLLLAFVDGGISLISLQAMDLLGGLGVVASLGVNLQGAKEFERVLEEKLGHQQVANFHAIVCDIVGVPRGIEPKNAFPNPTVPPKRQQPSYGVNDRGWSVHAINRESMREIRSYGC